MLEIFTFIFLATILAWMFVINLYAVARGYIWWSVLTALVLVIDIAGLAAQLSRMR